MHSRALFINEIVNYIDTPVIKIIKGIRRSGKSELLKLIISNLENCGISKEQIIYINYESIESYKYRDYMFLYNYIKSKVKKK